MDGISKGKVLPRTNVLMKKVVFALVILSLLFTISSAQDTLEQRIEDVNKKAKQMNVPDAEVDERAKSEAKKAYEYSQSPEFRSQVERFKRDLSILLGKEIPPQGTQEQYYSGYKPVKGMLSDDERIYIFISSSMPELTIRNYIKSASVIGNNIYLVLRGGIGGIKKLMPTVLWANELLKKNPYCENQCDMYGVKILIDPFLFRKYLIERVPAVVYVKGLQNPEGLSEGLSSVKVAQYWISFGDVSLDEHLKLIEEKSGRKFLQ